MRIIIVGCGKVGSTITEQLVKEGHDVAVIDRDSDVIQDMHKYCEFLFEKIGFIV